MVIVNKTRHKIPLAITLILFAVFVFAPMGAALEYSFRNGLNQGYGFTHYLWAIREEDFTYYIIRSSWLALLTVVITLVVLVPTVTWLHLTKSKLRPLIDTFSLLPLVIPVVAFAVGAQISLPEFVQNTVLELPFLYFILALPYSYRSMDIGLSSIPLKTITEAARSSGASWFRSIIHIVIPAIRTSVMATIALAFALSLGEYTLTVLLHWDTFPTWVTYVAQENILGAIAISMMALVIPFLLLTTITLILPDRTSKVSTP